MRELHCHWMLDGICILKVKNSALEEEMAALTGEKMDLEKEKTVLEQEKMVLAASKTLAPHMQRFLPLLLYL